MSDQSENVSNLNSIPTITENKYYKVKNGKEVECSSNQAYVCGKSIECKYRDSSNIYYFDENQNKFFTCEYNSNDYHLNYDNDLNDDDDSTVFCLFFGSLFVVLLITIIINKIKNKRYNRELNSIWNDRNTSNNRNNTTYYRNTSYDRNISYNRNNSSEIEDDLPPYNPNESSLPEINISIPNALINDSNNEELPPRYADVISENMKNNNNRELSS